MSLDHHLDPENFKRILIITFVGNIGDVGPSRRYVLSECSYYFLKNIEKQIILLHYFNI